MVKLTLAGLSADGTRLLLVSDAGAEFTLDVDGRLRAALRGEHARLAQLEIQMESTLRPRDIQARIRSGESAEAVAQAAQTSVDRIMAFAAPVLAERSHVADRAQRSSVRRKAGEPGARTLGEAVAAQLRPLNVDTALVEWDSWRREDGRWALTAAYTAGERTGSAMFVYDLPGNFVLVDNDDARWLVGEAVAKAPGRGSRDDLKQGRQRRLTSVPEDELPLGDDALEMVSEPATVDEEVTVDLTETAARVRTADAPTPATATTSATGAATDETEPDAGLLDETPRAPDTGKPGTGKPDTGASAPETTADPAATTSEESAPEDGAEEAPRRPVRKSRGRASVPSWDEIMFGGGKSD